MAYVSGADKRLNHINWNFSRITKYIIPDLTAVIVGNLRKTSPAT